LKKEAIVSDRWGMIYTSVDFVIPSERIDSFREDLRDALVGVDFYGCREIYCDPVIEASIRIVSGLIDRVALYVSHIPISHKDIWLAVQSMDDVAEFREKFGGFQLAGLTPHESEGLVSKLEKLVGNTIGRAPTGLLYSSTSFWRRAVFNQPIRIQKELLEDLARGERNAPVHSQLHILRALSAAGVKVLAYDDFGKEYEVVFERDLSYTLNPI
jgi:hypothetical protein